MKEVSYFAFRRCWLIVVCLLPPAGFAQESVTASTPASPTSNFAANVDEWVRASTEAPTATVEHDSLLLRKLFLTLIGLTPTIDETNQFLTDPNSERYTRAVDQLLARPEFVEHWAEKLDVMLMERRANTNVPQDQWTAWLRGQIVANRPLNQLMADLLVADGAPGEGRAAARFLLDRTGDANLITNDVGRIYFGRDIQCSQCHNHPSIESYRQSDYQGLFGFVSGLHLVEVADGDKKIKMVAEKSATDSPFESVFQRGTMHRVLPHLFGGSEFPQPWTIPGEDYQPAEAGRPAKPIHSRRQQLADAIRIGSLEHFNRNLANRLWTMVFGRGVVEPVDLHHADNPPLSEELLDGLSKQLVNIRFDLRGFVRELVNTQAFQRGQLELDHNGLQAPAWLVAALQNNADLLQQSEQQSTALREKRDKAKSEYDKTLDDIAALQTERLTALGNVDKVRNTLAQAVEATKKADAERQKAQQAHDSTSDKLAKLQAAADSSAVALQAVGQDAELAAAVELLKNRLATVQPTLEPLQKTLAEKNAVVQTATENQSKAKVALLDAQTAATEVDVRYRGAANHVNQQRTNFEQAALQLARTELNVHYHKTLSKWKELSDLAVQLVNKLEQDRKHHDQIEATLAGLVTARQVAEQKMPAMLAGAESLAAQLSAKKQVVESIAANLKRVADAKTTLAGTAGLLKSPEKISPVLDELDATALGLRGDLSAAEGELTAAVSAKEAGQNELNQLKQTLAQLQEQVAASEKRRDEHKQQQAALEAELSTVRQQQTNGLRSAAELISMRFLASRLRPLTPEQIGWSFLASTNVYKNYVDKHFAEIEKAAPATPEQLQDASLMAARRAEAVRKARAELQGNINHFISLYGAGPGQPQNDFFATPDQALYASNGGAIFSWATASGQNVTSQVVAATSGTEAAEKLYLGVLSRKPSPTEVIAVEQYLNQQPDIRAQLSQELVWSLMASAEFRFLP